MVRKIHKWKCFRENVVDCITGEFQFTDIYMYLWEMLYLNGTYIEYHYNYLQTHIKYVEHVI